MCKKNAEEYYGYGWCPPDGQSEFTDKDLMTKVREDKDWGFCSKNLCDRNDKTNVLKETKLTVLPIKHCTVFNSSTLSYNPKRELCAGKKINYPIMKVYLRGKKKNGGKYKYTEKKEQKNYVCTQLLVH